MSDRFDQDELIRSDIHAFLAQHEAKELLRFVAVGSVDDGKSTLIGRILHDAKGVYEDQLADASQTDEGGEVAIDFARITDGLQAEREQGITIDVAYRYFSTPKRKFIIADTPGHVQYTRNMATGASTANVAVILIDARPTHGVLTQSRRHSYIASLVGIPHLLVAVNKMDLVDYDQARYDEICADFLSFGQDLGFKTITFIPISALMGTNIVHASPKTPWYDGETVIEFLENVPISGDRNLDDFRYPVQYVLRPNLNYRGFSAQIASGVVRVGDELTVLPNGQSSRVAGIDTYEGEIEQAVAPLSVTIRLEDEIDVSRGDMLVPTDNQPHVGRTIDAMVVWMSEEPLDINKSYQIKHTTRYLRANIDEIAWKVDLETLEQVPADELKLNDIARVRLTTHRQLVFDAYKRNRTTGAFIIIDTLTNNTVAAGMIAEPTDGMEESEFATTHTGVSPNERKRLMGSAGSVVWLTGLMGSGRRALGFELERQLFDDEIAAAVIVPEHYDDPAMSSLLTNPETCAAAARRMADAGLVCICVVDAHAAADRARAAEIVGDERFFEVHVSTPVEVCAARKSDDEAVRLAAASFEDPSADVLAIDLTDGDDETAAKNLMRALRAAKVIPTR